MKTFITPLLLIFHFALYSQTPDEVNTLLRYTDLRNLNNLKTNLIINNKADSIVIENFINEKKLSRRTKNINGNLSEIKYIIDNKPIYITTDNIEAAKSTPLPVIGFS